MQPARKYRSPRAHIESFARDRHIAEDGTYDPSERNLMTLKYLLPAYVKLAKRYES